MSLRAELVRLGLRFMMKRRARPDASVQEIRSEIEAIKRYVPNPPKDTAERRIDAGGVRAIEVMTPQSLADRHVLYLHGGAYTYGSPSLYGDFLWRVANATAARVLCIAYRLAPEHPFPAAVRDAAAAYAWLLVKGVDPRRIALMGDSAGGGLVFATLLMLRDNGEPLPAAAVALSPWADLALTGDSLHRNAETESMLDPEQIRRAASHYLAGADERNPYASPLYGDLAGLPASLIQVSGDELLLDDSVRLAERLRAAGCAVEIEVWPRMPHVWQLFARVMPESRQALARIGAFVRHRFAQVGNGPAGT